MDSVIGLKIALGISSLYGGSLAAKKFCPYFSLHWWAVFAVFSTCLWIVSHILIYKYINMLSLRK